jgi:hypothetical protein
MSMSETIASASEVRATERESDDLFERIRKPLSAIARHDPPMVRLLQYWESRRSNGLLPAKRDIDPLDLKPFLGRLHLVDTRACDAEDYFFTLWGSSCYLDGGNDYTHLRLGDYPWPAWRRAVLQDYRDAVKFGVPAYHLVSAVNNRTPYQYARLILPLGENGRDVTQLLVHVRKRPVAELKLS